MAERLFGTDGVRGRAGEFPLDHETVARLGAALVRSMGGGSELRIVVGRDTRESGEWIERELARGVRSQRAQLTSAGVIPTPAIAYVTRAMGFDAGFVISASHNPFHDNGIKIFSGRGEKFTETLERKIEDIIADVSWQVNGSADIPVEHTNVIDAYIAHALLSFPEPHRLAPFRMAVDTANGATTTVAPRLFRDLGYDLRLLNAQPDGRNINLNCGSTHPEALSRAVVELGCRMGVAFDGDGDRAIFADASGRIVDGDAVLLMCARHMKAQRRLKGNAVVATVMSNIGLEIALRASGIELVRCPVGDKYVMEEMVAKDLSLGGEQSGHVIFSDFLFTGDGLVTALRASGIELVRCPVGDKYVMEEMVAKDLSLGGEQSGHVIFSEHLFTGDGMATALQVLRLMAETGRELSDLAAEMVSYPQILVNVRVREKTDLEAVPAVAAVIHDIESKLRDEGRLLVRYSGTEPLLRIMIEGRDQQAIQHWASQIAGTVKEHLGS